MKRKKFLYCEKIVVILLIVHVSAMFSSVEAQLIIPDEVPSAPSKNHVEKPEIVERPEKKKVREEKQPQKKDASATREIEAYEGSYHREPPRPQLPADLRLEPSYAECSQFSYKLTKYADVTYVWCVNGKEVRKGKGENVLLYTMGPPGELTMSVSLTDSQGREYSTSTGHTIIKEAKPLAYIIKAGVAANFNNILPAGYRKYSWRVEGQEIASSRSLQHKFMLPGRFILEGKAYDSVDVHQPSYSRVRYDVTVFN